MSVLYKIDSIKRVHGGSAGPRRNPGHRHRSSSSFEDAKAVPTIDTFVNLTARWGETHGREQAP